MTDGRPTPQQILDGINSCVNECLKLISERADSFGFEQGNVRLMIRQRMANRIWASFNNVIIQQCFENVATPIEQEIAVLSDTEAERE